MRAMTADDLVYEQGWVVVSQRGEVRFNTVTGDRREAEGFAFIGDRIAKVEIREIPTPKRKARGKRKEPRG